MSAETSRLARALIRFAWAVLIFGCGPDLDPRPADWAYLHEAIVVPSCLSAGCHSAEAHAGGIVLEPAGPAAEQLRAEQFVLPGDPNSPLLYLLEGRERARMPPDAPLPAVDVELIRRWIIEGAR